MLANVLVSQAADALDAGGERLPATGPSFRDATRVAGANERDLDRHLHLQPRRAGGEIDATIERLSEFRDALAAPTPPASRPGTTPLRDDRRRLLEAQLAGGPLHELRASVPNRPGVVAELALALGRAGVNITDMALYPAPDMSEGVVALWIAGDDPAAPRRGARREARLPGGPRVNARFDPSGPLRGRLAPPPDKSISHRAALLAAMASEPVRVGNYLDAADTDSTLAAVRALGAIVEERARRARRSAAPDCATRARPDEPIDVGNAGTLMRLLPGWLACQHGGTLHARRRRVDPPPADRPDRRAAAADGRRIDARDGRFPPFTVHGAPLHGHRVRAAGGERAGEVVRAAGRAGRPTADDGDRAHRLAATTPSGCCCAPASRSPATGRRRGYRTTVATSTSSSSIASTSRATCRPRPS